MKLTPTQSLTHHTSGGGPCGWRGSWGDIVAAHIVAESGGEGGETHLV